MPKLKLNKPKSRPAKSASRTGSANPGNSSYPDHEAVLTGLTDPFSAEAGNAQYPDSGAGRSMTLQQRVSFTMVADAAGTCSFTFNPKANFPLLYFASAAGTVITWPATYTSNADFGTNLLNNYGKAYRPTSFGARIANTLSATDSSGYLVIAKGGIPTISSTTTISPPFFTSFDQHPYAHGGEWHTTGNPKSANAYDYKDLATYDGNAESFDDTWETIYVTVFGAKASVTVGIVELYFNYEYVPKEDALIAQLARPQPTLNIQMQTAVNHVQSQHPTSHSGPKSVVTNFIKREGKKALLKHVVPFLTKKAVLALA